MSGQSRSKKDQTRSPIKEQIKQEVNNLTNPEYLKNTILERYNQAKETLGQEVNNLKEFVTTGKRPKRD